MFIAEVTERGVAPGLIATLAFNEARLGVISENIANATTPGYRAKQLDPRAFQESLKRAFAERDQPTAPLVFDGTGQVRGGRNGLLQVMPEEQPVDSALLHDGTNVSIEREMSELAETGMVHEFAATLLRMKFDGLRKAIRGTVS